MLICGIEYAADLYTFRDPFFMRASLADVEMREDGTIHHPAYGDITLDVMAELAEMEKTARVEASVERLQIAKENAAIGPRRNMMFGRVVAEIPTQDYLDQEELEPGCWTDKAFLKDFTKAMPTAKVESRSDKTVVRTPGLGGIDR